jgi:hypothetical protein
VAALLVLVLAVVLLVWRPWAGPSLVAQDFVVVPFQGQVPDDWQDFTVSGDEPYTIFGTRDWRGLLVDQDSDVLAEAGKALSDDPESLIHVFIDPAYWVYTSDSQGLADQVQSMWEGSTLVGQGTRQIDDREAFTASGVAPLGDDQVRVYAVTLQDEPRLFMLFICPNGLYDEWRPTFYEIVDSVRFTG